MLATFPGSAQAEALPSSQQELLRLMQAAKNTAMPSNLGFPTAGQQTNATRQGVQTLPSFVKDFDFWTETEHMKFLAAMKSTFKLDLATVALLIGSRTSSQVDSHYKLYMIARQKCMLGNMDGQDRELTLAEMYNAIGIYNLWIQHQMQRQAISLTSNSSNSNSNSNSNNNSNSNSSNNSRSNLSYNSMAGGNVNLSSLQTIGNFSALVGGTSSAMGLMSNDLESLKKLSSLQASLHTSQPAVNTQIDMLQQANAMYNKRKFEQDSSQLFASTLTDSFSNLKKTKFAVQDERESLECLQRSHQFARGLDSSHFPSAQVCNNLQADQRGNDGQSILQQMHLLLQANQGSFSSHSFPSLAGDLQLMPCNTRAALHLDDHYSKAAPSSSFSSSSSLSSASTSAQLPEHASQQDFNDGYQCTKKEEEAASLEESLAVLLEVAELKQHAEAMITALQGKEKKKKKKKKKTKEAKDVSSQEAHRSKTGNDSSGSSSPRSALFDVFLHKNGSEEKVAEEEEHKDVPQTSRKEWIKLGKFIEVKWRGEWWQAKIKKIKNEKRRDKNDQVLVSYVGGSDDEDEWLSFSSRRLRPPTDAFEDTSEGR